MAFTGAPIPPPLSISISTSTGLGPSSSSSSFGTAATYLALGQAVEPPRKRQRVSTQVMGDSNVKCGSYGSSWDEERERDERFYFPEADCVVRVGKTLFRVHKFLLARDASAFQDMFCMPADADPEATGTVREGGSDENPIVLYGETEDEFRVLLSALYALPHELQQYSTSRCDISQLITISYLTNKYHFALTSQWAISSLYHVLVKYSSPSITTSTSPTASPTSPTRPTPFPWDIERLSEEYDLNTCSPELLVRIMDVAMVCGHDELSTLVENRWIDRLWHPHPAPLGDPELGPQAPGAFSRGDEAKWAVSVADRWEMRRLRGVAYYVCLMEMGDELSKAAQGGCEGNIEEEEVQTHDDGQPSERQAQSKRHSGTGPPPALTPAQTTRLLLGHLSLTRLWDTRLQVEAPTIPAPLAGSCTYHQHGCHYTWVNAWRETARSVVTLKLQTHDVVGRVRSMERQLVANEGLIVALTPSCRRKGLGGVREMAKGLEASLCEHFLGGEA